MVRIGRPLSPRGACPPRDCLAATRPGHTSSARHASNGHKGALHDNHTAEIIEPLARRCRHAETGCITQTRYCSHPETLTQRSGGCYSVSKWCSSGAKEQFPRCLIRWESLASVQPLEVSVFRIRFFDDLNYLLKPLACAPLDWS